MTQQCYGQRIREFSVQEKYWVDVSLAKNGPLGFCIFNSRKRTSCKNGKENLMPMNNWRTAYSLKYKLLMTSFL